MDRAQLSGTQLPRHMPQLDALRAVAVLSVLLFHIIPEYFDKSPLGWLGVRFFFVLSGFLITGILLRGRERVEAGTAGAGFSLRQFYVRRFLRIFPIYYLVLFTLAVCGAGEIRQSFFWHLGYLSNFKFVADGYFHVWTAHFWTLAIEEQFYLLWPAIILFIPRRFLLPVLVLAIIIGPAYRYLALAREFSGLACEVLLPSSLDTLATGALLAVLLNQPGIRGVQRRLIAVVGWSAFIAFVTIQLLERKGLGNSLSYAVADSVFAVFAAAVIAGAAYGYSGWRRSILEFKPLLYVGTISYGLYVYHEIATTTVDALVEAKRLHLAPWGLIALKFALTFLAAALSWRFFEKPMNNLKRFFPYDPNSPGSVAVASGSAVGTPR